MRRLGVASRVYHLVFGILGVVIGATIVLWWAYNIFVERKAEFRPGGRLALFLVMIAFGVCYLRRAWTGRGDGGQPDEDAPSDEE
jgi:hypothetical protein